MDAKLIAFYLFVTIWLGMVCVTAVNVAYLIP